MAHFTLAIDPAGGPIISALVGVSQAQREELVAAEQRVPAPVSIRALIDTGAGRTCIDLSVLRTLQLRPTGTVRVYTASSGTEPHSSEGYAVSLVVPVAVQHHVPLTISSTPVIATELAGRGIQALIGRDILGDCMLVYNGSYGQFSLAF